LKDLSLDGNIILKLILKAGRMGVGWIRVDVAQVREKQWAVVNSLLHLLILQNAGNFLTR
jgi:hypothetical protein